MQRSGQNLQHKNMQLSGLFSCFLILCHLFPSLISLNLHFIFSPSGHPPPPPSYSILHFAHLPLNLCSACIRILDGPSGDASPKHNICRISCCQFIKMRAEDTGCTLYQTSMRHRIYYLTRRLLRIKLYKIGVYI